jgi:hypothetical protein
VFWAFCGAAEGPFVLEWREIQVRFLGEIADRLRQAIAQPATRGQGLTTISLTTIS